jgi:cytochrome c peroxidase
MKATTAILLLSIGLAVATACSDATTATEGAVPPNGGAEDAACDPSRAYPGGGEFSSDAPLPDVSFAALDVGGARIERRFRDYYEPCAERASLLVLRIGALWCGTCLWHYEHTGELSAAENADRILVVDLVLADEDNAPMTPEKLADARARTSGRTEVAVGMLDVLKLRDIRQTLPLFAVFDRRTMRLQTLLTDPDPDTLDYFLQATLADLDGRPRPRAKPDDLWDGRFRRNQADMIRAMRMPGPPPADPTNAHADDPAAAALGKALFSDARLSPSGVVSCAHCHAERLAFADNAGQSVGVGQGSRNAPSITFASHSRWQFWDGRADTLWGQALGPFENPVEFGATRVSVLRAVYQHHRAAYEAVFGPMPDLGDARFPASGKPGDAAFDALAPEDREALNRAFANVGKAIAAFERTLDSEPDALSAYANGKLDALTDTEKDGLLAFFRAGCAQCHFGPRLTNDAFHALRFPTGRGDGVGDEGRLDGVRELGGFEFRGDGPFSDDPAAASRLASVRPHSSMRGAFKTPTLRGIAQSAPYGHGGSLRTLFEVADLYMKAGLDATETKAVGDVEPWVGKFDHPTRDALVPFLRTLTFAPKGGASAPPMVTRR